ncbi:hypothetical protein NBRC116587_16220 [Pseudoteredinibacter isoporae]
MDILEIIKYSAFALWVYIYNGFLYKNYERLIYTFLIYCAISFLFRFSLNEMPNDIYAALWVMFSPIVVMYILAGLLSRYVNIHDWVNKNN